MELALEQTVTAWLHDEADDKGYHAMTLINTQLGGNAFIHMVLLEEGLAKKPENVS
jgi:hypothetical protein